MCCKDKPVFATVMIELSYSNIAKKQIRKAMHSLSCRVAKLSLEVYGDYSSNLGISWIFNDYIKSISKQQGALKLFNVKLSFKQIFRIIISGSHVDKILLADCYILEGSLCRRPIGISKLTNIEFRNIRGNPFVSFTNPQTYKSILTSLSLCPCVSTLQSIQLLECKITPKDIRSIKKDPNFNNIIITLQNRGRTTVIG
ncbi:unnamed protein product [Moneuplotes crassus]|uniref:Uncharacterized protein n=1 Tax=Euplotes crassus TaxID=5936 RepID=A0AAD2D3A5_EUPCR|nr:unnamed protein product [Moneuplotes crassus]